MSALFAALLWNSLLAGVLALPVLLLARYWRRPEIVHILWLVVLLKLVIPGVLRVDAIPRPAAAQATPAVAQIVSATQVSAAFQLPPTHPLPRRSLPLGQMAIAIWCAGSLLLMGIATHRIQRFKRALQHARPLDRSSRERVVYWAAQLGLKAPRALQLDANVPPMVWGWPTAPRLILPTRLLPRLSTEELDTLLIHELGHIQRGDMWIRWIELAIVTLLWWNPLAWWVRANLRASEEQACDSLVLTLLPRAKRAYADGIVKSVEFLAARGRTPTMATGATGTRLIKERLTMILNPSPARRLGRRALPALVFALLVLPIVPGFADRDRTEQDVAPEQALLELEREALELEQRMADLDRRRAQVEQHLEARRSEQHAEEMARHLEDLRRAGQIEEADRLASEIELERQRELAHRDRREFEMAHEKRARETELQVRELEIELQNADREQHYEKVEHHQRMIEKLERERRHVALDWEREQMKLQQTDQFRERERMIHELKTLAEAQADAAVRDQDRAREYALAAQQVRAQLDALDATATARQYLLQAERVQLEADLATLKHELESATREDDSEALKHSMGLLLERIEQIKTTTEYGTAR